MSRDQISKLASWDPDPAGPEVINMTPENEIRMRAFNAFTVIHPEFQLAIDTINKSLDMTRICGESVSPMLLGKSGTGKTRVCQTIIDQMGRPKIIRENSGIIKTVPVLYCKVPEDATIKKLTCAMLRKLGEDRFEKNQDVLEHRLCALLRILKTELVILDEWQHLIERGAERTRQSVCDWVKVFSEDHFHGAVLLSGIPYSELVVDQHDQLPRRYPYRAYLSDFSLHSQSGLDDFVHLAGAFSSEIEDNMGFTSPISLTDENILLALFSYSGGNIDALHTLLKEALRLALERDDKSLSKDDLLLAAGSLITRLRLTKKNPFSMTPSQLRHLIYR